MATITDIAKVANVSTATVSRVLNSPESVSAERRERVLHAIEALNYTPNANARDLVTKSTHVIGILLPAVSNTYSPAVINTFLQKTSEFGYNSLIAITNADDQKEHDYLQMMLTRRVEGLFLLGSRKRQSANNELLNQIALRTPVVMSDYLDLKNVSHVMTDEEHGAYLATQYLINLGHTRIGFVHGPLSMTTNYYKRQGYLRAMQEHALSCPEQFQIMVSPDFMGGYQAMSQFQQYSQAPTAIFFSGDQIAIGAYRFAHENKIRIPDDLSIIGFSGSPISMSTYPPLTTVAQYASEIGEKAAKIMIDLINNNVKQIDVILEPSILERMSCAAPKK